MPTIQKTKPPKKGKAKTKTAKKKAGGILNQIAPIGAHKTGLKFLAYGKGKTGKTRFACTFPKPLLLIGTEDGTKSVADVPGVDFVRIHSTDDLGTLTEMLQAGKYASVAMDTAGGVQDFALKEVLGLEDLPIHRSWGMAQRGDWHTSGSQVKERMRALLELAEIEGHPLNIIIIAHERSFNDESDSDVLFPTVGAALTPSVTGWLNGAVDYICQTHIVEATTTKAVKIAGKSKSVSKKTGKMEYRLRVGPHPVFMTGFRLPEGRTLPESISNPSYDKVLQLIEPSN